MVVSWDQVTRLDEWWGRVESGDLEKEEVEALQQWKEKRAQEKKEQEEKEKEEKEKGKAKNKNA